MSTQTAGQLASVSVDVGGQEIVFETGKLAKQADGAVVVRSGETMILATAVGRPDARPDADFFPLTVDVEEKMYAAGKIPGGLSNGRPRDRARDAHPRMIDRSIGRSGRRASQRGAGICTVLSANLVTPHDILCINGASAALSDLAAAVPRPRSARSASAASRTSSSSTRRSSSSRSRRSTSSSSARAEALTMVEAGADQVPEDYDPRGARAGARRDPQDLRGAGEPPRGGRQGEVGRRRPHGRARRRTWRPRSRGDRRARHQGGGVVVEQLVESLSPSVSMPPPRTT